jgi:hypothetical protein
MKYEGVKRTSKKPERDTLRKKYTLDYAKSKPNRFAAKLKGTTAVVLQPDVVAIFQRDRVGFSPPRRHRNTRTLS